MCPILSFGHLLQSADTPSVYEIQTEMLGFDAQTRNLPWNSFNLGGSPMAVPQ